MRPRSYTVPLVALGATLFVLVAAIVVVVGARAGAGAGNRCIVGTWEVIRHEEAVPLGFGLGSVTMRGGRGATLTLRADGTGEVDYGASGTDYHGEVGSKVVRLHVTGRVRFSYTAAEGAATLSNIDVAAEGQAYVDGVATGDPEALQPTGTATYRCAGDSLTEESGPARITYERAG